MHLSGPQHAGKALSQQRAAAARTRTVSLQPLPLRFAARKTPCLAFTTHRDKQSVVPQALAGGGAGSIGGDKGNWGSGGGGGGGGDGSGAGKGGEGSGDQQPKKKGWAWKGWTDRVAADPEFPFKVLLEQVIGVGASVIGDMSSRPNWGLNELDFVFATLVVGSIVNFSLMYLLAPTAAAAAGVGGAAVASQSLLVRALSDEFLVKWGAPGGNMFQAGFPVSKRLVNFAYKGFIFSMIGLMAGTVGTSISNGLLALRKQLDPTFVTQNEPPTVLGNAACWALHMGISSNLRYQLLGGADGMLVKVMPMGLFRVYSAAIRGLNNIVGGISFVTIARMFGVQKSGSSTPALAEA